jgi:CheY-like chemotaxis protein
MHLQVHAAASGEEALAAVKKQPFECVVLPLHVPDMSWPSLIEQLTAEARTACSLLLYTGTVDNEEEQIRYKRLAQEFGLGLADSPAALADEALLWAGEALSELPESCQALVTTRHDPHSVLSAKRVLIVDDDIRNIFALTSILERFDMVTVSAETGRAAINLLQAAEDVDIVLMDIMMPEMDGIDTMKSIRQISRFKDLPIVAVTAKAMKGDREKCIEAGAWDYLSKPVNSEQMLAVLQAWLAE